MTRTPSSSASADPQGHLPAALTVDAPTIQAVLSEVLSMMWPTVRVLPDHDRPVMTSPAFEVSIDVLGEPPLVLRIHTDLALASALATTYLGDGEHDPASCADAVAEFTNVLAGRVAADVFPDHTVGLPRHVVVESQGGHRPAPAGSSSFRYRVEHPPALAAGAISVELDESGHRC